MSLLPAIAITASLAALLALALLGVFLFAYVRNAPADGWMGEDVVPPAAPTGLRGRTSGRGKRASWKPL